MKDFEIHIPKTLAHLSGAVFYSGRTAFANQSQIYILGLNPGGSPESLSNQTISWHCNQVLQNKPEYWSEYKDEIWGKNMPGTHGLQPRILHLLEQIGYDPHLVPSSNVVFVRTRREADLKSKFNEYVQQCWPFHQNVINKLNIRVILCFGKTCGNHVRYQLKADSVIGEFVETNNRKWRSTAYKNDSGIYVISLTHPSIANWKNPNTDPSELVKYVISQC